MCVAKATSSQSTTTASLLPVLSTKKVTPTKARSSLSLKPKRKATSSLPALAPRPKHNDSFQPLSGQSILVPRFKESSLVFQEPTMYVPTLPSFYQEDENRINFDAKPSTIGFLTPAINSSTSHLPSPLAPKPRREPTEDYIMPSEILLPMLA